MNKGRKFVYAIVFALALFVVASCGIIDDTHLHLYVEGTCECGDKEVNWPELPKHTVSFVDDNGNLISEASVLEGSLVQEPVSPTKEGEHFVGWYNGEVKWNFEKNPVLGETTLKAHFVENAKYEITYELNGGEFKEGEQVEVEYISGIGTESLATPVKEHYVFVGWFMNNERVTKIPAHKEGNVTLVAKWALVEHTILFDTNGGEFNPGAKLPNEFKETVGLEKLPTPSRIGYTFVSWTLDGEEVSSISKEVTKDVVLVAKWQINEYTLTFNIDGKEQKVVYDYNESVAQPMDPEKEGYTFLGWDKEIPANMPAEDVTVTALWQINKYNVTFKLENGEKDVVTVQNYGTAIKAPTPKKTGYTFKGWDVLVPETVPASDVTAVAVWEINKYTVTFKLENGEKDVVTVQNYGTAIKAPTPEKTGYTFKGWDVEVPKTVPAEDVTAVAVWEINKYTVTFKLENGEADVQNVLEYGAKITAPKPEKEGYAFVGWDKEVAQTVSTSNLVYTAKWEINQYMVTFKLGNGQADVILKQDYQTEITAPTPTREGYAFKGWDIEVPETVPANDVVAVAVWEVNKYTVTFVLGNGEADIQQELEYGAKITVPTPTRLGYTFKGWDVRVPETVPANDVTAVAQWEVNKYSVVFKLDNGEADIQEELEYGAKITVPTPIRLGYTFKGWDIEVPKTVPASDVTAVAQWEIKAIITIEEAVEIAKKYGSSYSSEAFTIEGYVKNISNSTYGNMNVQNGSDVLFVYGVLGQNQERFDKLTEKPQEGDYIKLTGKLGTHNGSVQMKNGKLEEFSSSFELSFADKADRISYSTTEQVWSANGVTLVNNKAKSSSNVGDYINPVRLYQSSSVVISSVKPFTQLIINTTGGKNVTELVIEGATSTLEGATWTIVFNEAVTKVDLGLLSKQMRVSSILVGEVETPSHEHVVCPICKGCTDPECPEDNKCLCNEEEGPKEVSIAEAKELTDGTEVIISGTVKSIDEAWNEQYSNITVTIIDKTGEIKLYRLATKVVLGDIITVTGKVGSYNDSKQIAQGATAVITGHDTSYDQLPTITTIKDANTAQVGSPVVVSGTVMQINEEWDSYYKNITVTITDGTYTLYVYRLATQVKLGDIITVTGTIGSYDNANQVAKGATAVITGHDTSYDEEEKEEIPSEPETPENNNIVDLNTITNTNKSYVTSTTTSGWVAKNAAVLKGGTSNSNPAFIAIGSEDNRAVCLNGKTSAVGTLTSPTLSGGIKNISFSYTNVFTESNGVDITINIKDSSGTVIASTRLDDNSVTKYIAEEFTWNLETPVSGDFTIEILNNSPSNSTSNKDRVAIWDITWESNK